MCIRIVPWYVACVFGFLLDYLSVGRVALTSLQPHSVQA